MAKPEPRVNWNCFSPVLRSALPRSPSRHSTPGHARGVILGKPLHASSSRGGQQRQSQSRGKRSKRGKAKRRLRSKQKRRQSEELPSVPAAQRGALKQLGGRSVMRRPPATAPAQPDANTLWLQMRTKASTPAVRAWSTQLKSVRPGSSSGSPPSDSHPRKTRTAGGDDLTRPVSRPVSELRTILHERAYAERLRRGAGLVGRAESRLVQTLRATAPRTPAARLDRESLEELLHTLDEEEAAQASPDVMILDDVPFHSHHLEEYERNEARRRAQDDRWFPHVTAATVVRQRQKLAKVMGKIKPLVVEAQPIESPLGEENEESEPQQQRSSSVDSIDEPEVGRQTPLHHVDIVVPVASPTEAMLDPGPVQMGSSIQSRRNKTTQHRPSPRTLRIKTKSAAAPRHTSTTHDSNSSEQSPSRSALAARQHAFLTGGGLWSPRLLKQRLIERVTRADSPSSRDSPRGQSPFHELDYVASRSNQMLGERVVHRLTPRRRPQRSPTEPAKPEAPQEQPEAEPAVPHFVSPRRQTFSRLPKPAPQSPVGFFHASPPVPSLRRHHRPSPLHEPSGSGARHA